MGGPCKRPAPDEALETRPDLRELAERGRFDAGKLIDTANDLLALAAELGASTRPDDDRHLIHDPGAILAMAQAEYRRRRNRTLFFEDESLFGEPAWDILLDLFIAGLERKLLPVTSACIGAAVPTTTALRWLALLEERGQVIREPDPTDARRAHVRLSPEARARMEQYFQRAYPAGRP